MASASKPASPRNTRHRPRFASILDATFTAPGGLLRVRLLKGLFTALAAAALMIGGLLALAVTVLTAAAIFLARRLFRPATAGPSMPPSRGPRPARASGPSDVIEVSATEISDGPSSGDPSRRVGLTSGRS